MLIAHREPSARRSQGHFGFLLGNHLSEAELWRDWRVLDRNVFRWMPRLKQKGHRDVGERNIQRQRDTVEFADEPVFIGCGEPKIVDNGSDLSRIDHA